jgi:hypothetical protein
MTDRTWYFFAASLILGNIDNLCTRVLCYMDTILDISSDKINENFIT